MRRADITGIIYPLAIQKLKSPTYSVQQEDACGQALLAVNDFGVPQCRTVVPNRTLDGAVCESDVTQHQCAGVMTSSGTQQIEILP